MEQSGQQRGTQDKSRREGEAEDGRRSDQGGARRGRREEQECSSALAGRRRAARCPWRFARCGGCDACRESSLRHTARCVGGTLYFPCGSSCRVADLVLRPFCIDTGERAQQLLWIGRGRWSGEARWEVGRQSAGGRRKGCGCRL